MNVCVWPGVMTEGGDDNRTVGMWTGRNQRNALRNSKRNKQQTRNRRPSVWQDFCNFKQALKDET